MWYHVHAGWPGPASAAPIIENAAWCYPEPTAGRENLKDHVTFATGKGIGVSGPEPTHAPEPEPEPEPELEPEPEPS